MGELGYTHEGKRRECWRLGFVVKLLVGVTLLFVGGLYAFADTKAARILAPDMHISGEIGERAKVMRVIDGDSLVLEGGLRVTLVDIQAPKTAWPEKNYKAWPLAQDAKAYLDMLVTGKTVQLYYHGARRDRYGRATAQVRIVDPDTQAQIWLQKSMVTAGYARIYPWGSDVDHMQDLYRAEVKARAEKRGIWDGKSTDGFYDIRPPDPNPLAQYVDSVQIVEGIVISAADVRGMVYLNFGSDYKTDFTIAISKKNAKKFAKQGFDLLALEGAKVRVRGWIELYNGPTIWLTNLHKLEVLD